MKAVNLIPAGSGQRASAGGLGRLSAAHAVLGVLAVALAFTTVYVLSANSVSDRQAKLAALNAQLAQAQAEATRLSPYTSYARLAQARTATVLQIASSRFDWHGALADLARVIPANSRLQSLLATVAPGVTVSGAGGSSAGGGASTSALRSDISAPAFELRGCTTSHDAVARLVTRLQLINGVQRVTLADSVRAPSAAAHASHASPTSSGVSSSGVSTTGASATGAASLPTVTRIAGCGNNPASFDLVVFFTPLAGVPTAASGGSTPATGAATPSTPVGSTTPSTTGSPAGSTPASSTPATSTPSASTPSVSTPAAAASSAGAAAQQPVSTPTAGSTR